MDFDITTLAQKLKLEQEIKELKLRLKERESNLAELVRKQNNHSLTNEEISRFSRQIIVPQVGVKGQEKLKAGNVIIIGCGGLGCPAAQYLTGSGVGHIGLVDYDEVEINNLHRQLLHDENNKGQPKVDSAANSLKRLNSAIKIIKYPLQLDSSNALRILSQYDVVVDASDNVATRYLVNDACVILGKTLVSGSAVQMEGQLTVYNYNGGPCYRCLFPNPPPPNTVTNCGDAGVLGPVPGVIGVLQALQVIHILLESEGVLSSKMLLFDATDSMFRTIKLRGKKKDCEACGKSSNINKLIDYEQFCGAPAHDKGKGLKILTSEERVSPRELSNAITKNFPHVLIDVRQQNEFEICHLPGSINFPMASLSKNETKLALSNLFVEENERHNSVSVYLICRRGNDSQLAVKKLKEIFCGSNIIFKDIQGGLHNWTHTVDPTFPIY